MPAENNNKSGFEPDVIVVGSGAGGGMAAYLLAISGVKVLMLEAGRNYDPLTETPMFQTPKDAPLRAAPTPQKPFGFFDATVDGGWQVPNEPYTSAPGTDFWWWRARMLGGRTNHWGRISLRMGENDFKPRTRDGLGVDWPIGYNDLKDYYDKVERLIGVFGSNEGLSEKTDPHTPRSPEGILLPPPQPRAYEILTQKACKKLGIRCIPSRLAILSRRLDAQKIPELLHPGNELGIKVLRESMASRSNCFWATECGRGCNIKANFQSTTVLLPPALATGNLRIITNAMVREVTVDSQGLATGVNYIDKITRKDRRARARVVILAASACESARILLNSNGRKGVANGNGMVGRYLMDTVGSKLTGYIPALENIPHYNEDGSSSLHLYMPWWKHADQLAGKLDFARGYHIEFGGGRRMPGAGIFSGLEELTQGAYGQKFKEECRRYYGAFVSFSGRGEMIPNENCYCELDPDLVDTWGIPVLRFHWKWSEHELRQAVHMQQTFAEIIGAMKGRVLGSGPQADGQKAIAPPGSIIHEVGATRMGADNATSVLNSWCQSHQVKNLFVTDGGPLVTNSDKNPTLTIMALAWRTCDYLMEEMRKGSIG